MGKPTGFLEYQRTDPGRRPVAERIHDYKEFTGLLSADEIRNQAARCMDCGIPFCHAVGCPVRNRIPDWNDLVYHDHWQRALQILHATDNFPEITGRVCPAPCEAACTLSITSPAVSIRHIELQIVEKGWDNGWIQPEPSPFSTGKKVAVIGSGPAGLTAAQQLARMGHTVVVFEKSNRIGGILRYGIPDFKLEKWVIDRRLEQLKQEGVVFETGVDAGVDMSIRYLRRTFDAIVITAGATIPRELRIPGSRLQGFHFAMAFLTQQNRHNAGDSLSNEYRIDARDKEVVVIGGGDTGSDCVGTSHRQGARSVTQIEILPQPPVSRDMRNPWPVWPNILRTSSSHEEGCQRMWSVMVKELIGQGKIEKIKAVKLDWSGKDPSGRQSFSEVPSSEFEINADLVLLAAGFLHVEHGPLIQESGLPLDDKGNILVDQNYMTPIAGIFAAGDCVMGASLVVKAFFQGREAATAVNRFLLKS
jgi:glutamate synthase (NADPH) small chain